MSHGKTCWSSACCEKITLVAATFIVICTVLFNILYLDITIRLFSLNIPQNYSTIIPITTPITAINPNSTSFENNTTDDSTFSSSITLVTSEETTTETSTTTTSPQTTVTNTTTPTSPTTRTTRTTTTNIPEPCPSILSEPREIKNLLLLDDKATSSNYTNYEVQFVTPVDATTALLVFSFRTKTGSWYLDDVSLKRSDGSGNELIRNGGFENGIFNILWKYCSPKDPSMSILISQQFCHSGRYCFASRGYFDDTEYLSQNFTIQSNTMYTIELYTFCKGEPLLFNATISFK